MGFRMMALVVVDKIRSKLIQSLMDSHKKILVVEETSMTDIKDPNTYLDPEAPVITVVDRRLLASMVIFTCIMTRTQCSLKNLDQPIVEVCAGKDRNDIMFDGVITLNDLLEMAEQAEVDHVVDFLLSDNITLDRHQ